jgi:hypothetical protein
MEGLMNVSGSKDGEGVVRDSDNVEPTKVDTPEERRPPIAGPSNQPAAAAAPVAAIPDPVALPEPEPVPKPVPVADPPTQALTHILEVVPNVDPEFLYPLIATHLPNFGDDPTRTAEYIVGVVFEMGDQVPKVNMKGKRKNEDGAGSRGEGKEQADDDEKRGKKVKVDWASVDRPFRGTGKYIDIALVFHFLNNKRACIDALIRSTFKLPFRTFQNDICAANLRLITAIMHQRTSVF